MANMELPNDVVRWEDIKVRDASGTVVPAAAGDVFTATSGDPTLYGAVVGTNPKTSNPGVGVNALIFATLKGPALPFKITDSAGLTAFTSDPIDIVEDTTATSLGIAPASSNDVAQA